MSEEKMRPGWSGLRAQLATNETERRSVRKRTRHRWLEVPTFLNDLTYAVC
jgi:hypothetical protein